MSEKNFLRNMRITEVSFVDKGANPGAHVTFYKRDQETIAKYHGELVNSVPPELEKVYATTFANMIVSEDKMSAYYKLMNVLGSSIRSICEDATLDAARASEMLVQTLNEFYNTALAELVAKAVDPNYKVTDPASSAPGGSLSAGHSEDGGSMATNDELAKRVSELEGTVSKLTKQNEELTVTKKTLEEETEKLKSKLNKAGDAEGDACMIDGKEGTMTMEDGKLVCVSKADLAKRNAVPESVRKQLDEQASEIKKLRDREELTEFTKRAQGFSRLAIAPEAFAPILRKIVKALTEDENKEFDRVLKAAHEGLGTLTRERGTGGSVSGGAFEKLNGIASELRKSDPNMTSEVAFSKACSANPALYDQYKAERKSAASN